MNAQDALPNVIGHLIRAARKARNLTQVELAQQLGITGSAVAQWETGKTIPSGVSLLKLSGILSISFPSVDEDQFSAQVAPKPCRSTELLDEIETVYDLLTALDKTGDGIGGDIGHGVSAVALAARAALDNARSMVRAMGEK